MSEKDLYDQLFNTTPDSWGVKKEENKDLLTNLFNLQINTGGGSLNSGKKKKKKDDEVHQYIKLAEKSNDKAKKSVQKWKDEQTLTSEQIRHKRQFQKITSQFQKTKPSVTASDAPKKKEYLPNIINPFEKPEKKIEKSKPTTAVVISEPVMSKKLVEKVKEKESVRPEKERVSKVEQKEEKIIRKEVAAIPVKDKERVIKKQQEPKKDKPVLKQKKPSKKRKSSSSSSSSSASSSQQSESQEPYNWRKQLRQITKYNPNDEKFKKRDQYVIKQSGIDRMFGEDRFSSRMGRLEQEEDMIREMKMKHKKEHRHRD